MFGEENDIPRAQLVSHPNPLQSKPWISTIGGFRGDALQTIIYNELHEAFDHNIIQKIMWNIISLTKHCYGFE
jgi:hypothetical protein